MLLIEIEHCYWQHTTQDISEHKGSKYYEQTVTKETMYFNTVTLFCLKMQP